MVQDAMDDMPRAQLKTKDFVAMCDTLGSGRGMWFIAPVRLARAAAYIMAASSLDPREHEHGPPKVRLGNEDAATMWLAHEPAQGLLKQFWCKERGRFEAADEDEAYALLLEIQRTFANKALN